MFSTLFQEKIKDRTAKIFIKNNDNDDNGKIGFKEFMKLTT